MNMKMNLKDPFNNRKLSIDYILKGGSVIDHCKKELQKKDILIENKILRGVKAAPHDENLINYFFKTFEEYKIYIKNNLWKKK